MISQVLQIRRRIKACHAGDERGASAVEYGLLIAGIAAVIGLAVFTFGGVVSDALFTTSCTTISSSVGSAADC